MLAEHGIRFVYHYVPLHYFIFILRNKSLLSKTSLTASGFSNNHFRSTSKKQDIERGFEEFVHLSILDMPPILKAKLDRGFPHFELKIRADYIDTLEYYLCRFNIAKARYFKGAKSAPEESNCNGRYYGDMALPVAYTRKEKDSLLECNLNKNMIEVLIGNEVRLTNDVTFSFFSEDNLNKAHEIAGSLCTSFPMQLHESTALLKYNKNHSDSVNEYLDRALNDSTWTGNGLEYDKL